MNKREVKNLKDFCSWIREENSNYLAELKESGGFGLHLRRLTAQILWLSSYYFLGIWLLPMKDFLSANAVLFIVLGLTALLWSIIKSQLPLWVGSLMKGDFFYYFEGWFLNVWIFSLILLNVLLFLIPVDLYKKLIRTKND